jgi:peptidoglycan/xylan/chitin deacetylase (PgdA/CDA1 family)
MQPPTDSPHRPFAPPSGEGFNLRADAPTAPVGTPGDEQRAPAETRAGPPEQRIKRRLEVSLARVRWRRPHPRSVVLCYHSVHPSKPFASATPSLFEQHVEWLAAHCEVVPYGALLEPEQPGGPERPRVAITLDDGFDDNFDHALPILLAHHVQATVFVTSGLVDGDGAVVRRFGHLWGAEDAEVRGLTWSQVSEMRDAGMRFGAHTYSHPNLARLSEADVLDEILRSKESLEDHLREEIADFAYPFGRPRHHVLPRTRELAAGVGFETGATILYRGARTNEDRLAIPRFPVTRDPIEVLAAKVYGTLDVIGLWQERAPLWLSRLVAQDPSRIHRS